MEAVYFTARPNVQQNTLSVWKNENVVDGLLSDVSSSDRMDSKSVPVMLFAVYLPILPFTHGDEDTSHETSLDLDSCFHPH